MLSEGESAKILSFDPFFLSFKLSVRVGKFSNQNWQDRKENSPKDDDYDDNRDFLMFADG